MLRLSPAANTRRCQLPSATGKPGRICKKPAPGTRSANGGHGGAARPRSRQSYGSLSESAVEPEPASESVEDTKEVVSRSSASPSSSAAAALAAARALSAASRNGRTTRPARCSPSSACRHQVSATTRIASPARTVLSNIAPTSSGSEYWSSGSSGSSVGMPERSRSRGPCLP